MPLSHGPSFPAPIENKEEITNDPIEQHRKNTEELKKKRENEKLALEISTNSKQAKERIHSFVGGANSKGSFLHDLTSYTGHTNSLGYNLTPDKKATFNNISLEVSDLTRLHENKENIKALLNLHIKLARVDLETISINPKSRKKVHKEYKEYLEIKSTLVNSTATIFKSTIMPKIDQLIPLNELEEILQVEKTKMKDESEITSETKDNLKKEREKISLDMPNINLPEFKKKTPEQLVKEGQELSAKLANIATKTKFLKSQFSGENGTKKYVSKEDLKRINNELNALESEYNKVKQELGNIQSQIRKRTGEALKSGANATKSMQTEMSNIDTQITQALDNDDLERLETMMLLEAETKKRGLEVRPVNYIGIIKDPIATGEAMGKFNQNVIYSAEGSFGRRKEYIFTPPSFFPPQLPGFDVKKQYDLSGKVALGTRKYTSHGVFEAVAGAYGSKDKETQNKFLWGSHIKTRFVEERVYLDQKGEVKTLLSYKIGLTANIGGKVKEFDIYATARRLTEKGEQQLAFTYDIPNNDFAFLARAERRMFIDGLNAFVQIGLSKNKDALDLPDFPDLSQWSNLPVIGPAIQPIERTFNTIEKAANAFSIVNYINIGATYDINAWNQKQEKIKPQFKD